jgi:glycosyltransferase involved in cell wall biosynthesis
VLDGKIRILHIIESGGPGGAETVLLNIVNNLDENEYHSIVVLLRTGWLHQQLKKNAISTILLKSLHSYDLSFLIRLWLNVKERKVDLIHSHLPDVNLYSCLAGFAARIPIVTTYHGSPTEPQGRINSYGLKYPLIRTLSTRIVAVSDWLKDDLVKTARFPPKKLKTIYNGVDWKRFDLPSNSMTKRKELNIAPDEKVVGMVANLRPAKGYEYFIRAAAIIAEDTPKVKFLVIGEEEETVRKTITREIDALGLTDKVILLGFREDVPELLKLLDVFVLSSVSEGLSIATIEAMAAGIPTVVTKSGGPQEVVLDGRTGFLAPPKDEKSLAEKVLLLLGNRELAASMGQEAQARVKARFGIDTMIENYETLYHQCLNQREGQV